MTLEVLACRVLGPVCGSLLFAFFDDLNCVDSLVAVGELLKVLASLRIADCLGPLTKVAVHQFFHLLFHLSANPQLVVDDHLSQIVDTAGEVLDPPGSPLKFVCRSNIEYEISINDRNDFLRRHIFRKQFRMPGFGTSIATNENVISLLGCNQSETDRKLAACSFIV